MARALVCLLGGSVCGIGVALALTYVALMFGPDNLLEF
jgi:hypothetical protein